MKETEIKKFIRENYAKAAKQSICCCDTDSSCCNNIISPINISKAVGYSEQDMDSVPEEANLGLGCGNPIALASLQEGEVVLDLGSGGGFDCFLAANRVGKTGHVIGVDMTPEMIDRARDNAQKNGYDNVEFRLGEIENLPAADNSVDAVISNCVINLSVDKGKVFREAFRVLRPGGRLMVSDIVLTKELPEEIRNSVQAYVGCVSGAMEKPKYMETIEASGFENITVVDETSFAIDCCITDPTAQSVAQNLNLDAATLSELADTVRSVKIAALKPA